LKNKTPAMSCAITAGRRFLTFIMRMSRGEDRQPSRSPKTRRGGLPSSVISSRRFMCSPRARIRPYHGYVKAGLCDTAKLQGQCPLWVRSRHQDIFAMSALPPKANIGTGTCITFDAATPAAWRCWLRSAAPRPHVRRARPQLNSVAGVRCGHADYLERNYDRI